MQLAWQCLRYGFSAGSPSRGLPRRDAGLHRRDRCRGAVTDFTRTRPLKGAVTPTVSAVTPTVTAAVPLTGPESAAKKRPLDSPSPSKSRGLETATSARPGGPAHGGPLRRRPGRRRSESRPWAGEGIRVRAHGRPAGGPLRPGQPALGQQPPPKQAVRVSPSQPPTSSWNRLRVGRGPP